MIKISYTDFAKGVGRFCFISHNPPSWSCVCLIPIRVFPFHKATHFLQIAGLIFFWITQNNDTLVLKKVFSSSWIGQPTWSSKFTSCLSKKNLCFKIGVGGFRLGSCTGLAWDTALLNSNWQWCTFTYSCFTLFCSITYSLLRYVNVLIKQKVSYSNSSWTQTILAAKLIRWVFH